MSAAVFTFPGLRLAEQRERLRVRTRQREKAEAVLAEARKREAEERAALAAIERTPEAR